MTERSAADDASAECVPACPLTPTAITGTDVMTASRSFRAQGERRRAMQTDNRFLDDLARVATSALGTLQGVRDEMSALVRQQVERVIGGLDMVSREEFDAVKAMAANAREENEAQAARIAELEAEAGIAPPAGVGRKRRPGKRTTRRSTTARTPDTAGKAASRSPTSRATAKRSPGRGGNKAPPRGRRPT